MVLLFVGLVNRGATITENTDYSRFNQAMIAYYLETGHPQKALHYVETLHLD